MSISIAIGLLTAAAVYLFMQRGMVRIVLGFVMASHAANLLLFAAGNTAFRGVPYIGTSDYGVGGDPLPQAFVLTAIVIAFSITMFMITLAITTTKDDDTENAEESPAKLLTSADTEFSRNTLITGAMAAGTGGAHASPMSPVHDFEGRDDDSAEAPNADQQTGQRQTRKDLP
ncbi:sodium:proton antiporter [Nesterenkonia sphaerica]|uniref:Cation:proton antiporter n=1 Tax=Nesterenkonia sphaerica TaxID=1804988 RepID=A0A5R9ADB3_9MICC|nr:cation:proton antiporter subunit C [Nesterenkonia sphaerica]TLP75846.1 cation:proton antiporter [Nesterenkonia sphaerica]